VPLAQSGGIRSPTCAVRPVLPWRTACLTAGGIPRSPTAVRLRQNPI